MLKQVGKARHAVESKLAESLAGPDYEGKDGHKLREEVRFGASVRPGGGFESPFGSRAVVATPFRATYFNQAPASFVATYNCIENSVTLQLLAHYSCFLRFSIGKCRNCPFFRAFC